MGFFFFVLIVLLAIGLFVLLSLVGFVFSIVRGTLSIGENLSWKQWWRNRKNGSVNVNDTQSRTSQNSVVNHRFDKSRAEDAEFEEIK